MSSGSYVDVACDAFRTACDVPVLNSGRINDDADLVTVQCTWSQTSIAAGQETAFTNIYAQTNGSWERCSDAIPLSGNDLQRTRGNLRVQIVKLSNQDSGSKNSGSSSSREVLNVFRNNRIIHSVNLSELDLHGPVYRDEELGGIAISASGKRLAYIAEAKEAKTMAFCSDKRPPTTGEDHDHSRVGQEYDFKQDFGEQMVAKYRPVVVMVDLNQGEHHSNHHQRRRVKPVFTVFDKIFEDRNLCPGQLSFWGDDYLLGIVIETTPRKLGIVYCSNRRSFIFKLCVDDTGVEDVENVDDTRLEILSSTKNVGAKSPRVAEGTDSPSLVVWLERDLGESNNIYPGPHKSAMRLLKLNLDAKDGLPEVVVGLVASQDKISYIGDNDGDEFKNIFEVQLPQRCFAMNNRFLVMSTVVEDTYVPIVIDLGSGAIAVQRRSANHVVLDVVGNRVLAAFSQPLTSPQPAVAELQLETGDTPALRFDLLEATENLLPDYMFRTVRLKPEASHPDPSFADVDFSYIFIGPKCGREKSTPLIVWPHGGPHAVVPTTFMNAVYFFCQLGYAIVFVNYRGSLGAGKKSVDSLPGHIGDTDVRDCDQARRHVLESSKHLDPAAVLLLGGSHGGFLVTHLAARYPQAYKAVVARNPVVNVASMASATDIPDWTFNEMKLPFAYESPRPESLQRMYDSSPIAHIHKVKAPIFLMIGKQDLRVPPSQGFEYYYELKALGKAVRMNVYEDNHPLAKVPVNVNVMINAAVFYHETLSTAMASVAQAEQ